MEYVNKNGINTNSKKSKRLLIISHSAMFSKNNEVYAFGPVVRELESFVGLFSGVTWIGFSRPDCEDDPAFKKVDPKFVTVIMIPKTGGDTFFAKIGVLLKTPKMLRIIYRQVSKHHIIHTRAPSSPAFIGIVLSQFFKKKIWWHKYAGNWVQKKPPLSYGLQIACLKRAKYSKVTINGSWPHQPSHCLSFENPTITLEDHEMGFATLHKKKFQPPYNFCFAGRLESEKGLSILLKAYDQVAENPGFGQLHIVGAGPLKDLCMEYKNKYPSIIFHGSLSREELNKVYEKCHFLYLPSKAAEGFPKVIAEGANYGCIPIVSPVSSIKQYLFNEKNGFLLDDLSFDKTDLVRLTNSAINNENLKNIAFAAYEFSRKFTYDRYVTRIKNEILG